MESIGELLKKLGAVQKKRGPNSKRAYWVELTADRLKKPFRQVLGITADWPVQWIEDMYLHCNRSDNFGRLWWGLIKKSKK